MDPRLRYYVYIRRLKNLPEYNRARAEMRFLLVREFLDSFEKKESESLGSRYRRKEAIARFSALHGLAAATFWRWLSSYKKFGIEGLVPLFGRVGTSRGAGKASGQALKPTGGTPRRKRLVIEFNYGNPLSCLKQILDFIKRSHDIAPDDKEEAVLVLTHCLAVGTKRTRLSLRRPLAAEEIEALLRYKRKSHKNHAVRATAILMAAEGRTLPEVCLATGHAASTILRWLWLFKQKGLSFIETKPHYPGRDELNREQYRRVVEILHCPPSTYGINRTSWTYETIGRVYAQSFGERISRDFLRRIIRKSRHGWRHSVKVYMSSDPHYKEKVEQMLAVLQGLKSDEAFFFVDESGPWQVKKYGGKSLVPPGVLPTVPEVQHSRGRVNFIIALEAKTNQVTWTFIRRKDAATLTAFLGGLKRKYHGLSRLFLTWDAMSTHRSEVVGEWMAEENRASNGPRLETVPLPSGAQFLNVVEAVIGGMKQAVVNNSDYPTREVMEAAISRHFEERNAFFLENPKRAGNKIWDKEAFDIEKLRGGLFKRW